MLWRTGTAPRYKVSLQKKTVMKQKHCSAFQPTSSPFYDRVTHKPSSSIRSLRTARVFLAFLPSSTGKRSSGVSIYNVIMNNGYSHIQSWKKSSLTYTATVNELCPKDRRLSYQQHFPGADRFNICKSYSKISLIQHGKKWLWYSYRSSCYCMDKSFIGKQSSLRCHDWIFLSFSCRIIRYMHIKKAN